MYCGFIDHCDPEGWKLRPGDASTRSEDAPTPEGVEDKDEAAASHRIMLKSCAGHAYAPEDGLTTPVPRFRDDIDALIQLSNFDLPPLRVVRTVHVVHVYCGFIDASGKNNSVRPCQRVTAANSGRFTPSMCTMDSVTPQENNLARPCQRVTAANSN